MRTTIHCERHYHVYFYLRVHFYFYARTQTRLENWNKNSYGGQHSPKEKHRKYGPESNNHSSIHHRPITQIWDQMATLALKFDHTRNETRKPTFIWRPTAVPNETAPTMRSGKQYSFNDQPPFPILPYDQWDGAINVHLATNLWTPKLDQVGHGIRESMFVSVSLLNKFQMSQIPTFIQCEELLHEKKDLQSRKKPRNSVPIHSNQTDLLAPFASPRITQTTYTTIQL